MLRTRFWRIIALLIGTIPIGAAIAQVNASFPSGGGTVSVGNPSAGHYTVTLTRTDTGSGTIDALVTGAGSDVIDWIVVATNSAPGITQITVRGNSPSTSTGSLGSLTKTGTGPVTLAELRLAGDLGSANSTAIAVDTVAIFRVGDDVLGDVSVVNDSFALQSTVGGDFLGDLTISSGSILNLPITGSLGSGSASTVTIGGNVVMLTAASFWVDMTVSGVIESMQATGPLGSGLSGSVTASKIALLNASTGGLSIPEGALSGTLHITDDVSLPIGIRFIDSESLIQIDGDLTTTGYIGVASDWEGDIEIGGDVAGWILSTGCPLDGSSIHIGGNVTSTGLIDLQTTLTSFTLQDIVIDGNMGGQILLGTLGTGSNLYGTIDVGGDLTGLIHVIYDARAFGVGGSVYGDIVIGGDLYGQILIDDDLASDGSLSISDIHGTPALKGQVIIGRRGQGRWDGAVFVNGVELDGPFYADTSASLGGGAVGVVPFHMHETDCDPPNGDTDRYEGVLQTALDEAGTNEILVRFYGPIELADPENMDITDVVGIEMMNPGSPCVWYPMGSFFNIVLHPDGNERAIGIRVADEEHPPPAGIWRLVITDAEGLVCAGVSGDRPTVWPDSCEGLDGEADAYEFHILPDCNNNAVNDLYEIDTANPDIDGDNDDVIDDCESLCVCDFDESGMVGPQDIFDFLAAWFGGCVGNPLPAGCFKSADFNSSGTLTAQDIFDFLACWFSYASLPCE